MPDQVKDYSDLLATLDEILQEEHDVEIAASAKAIRALLTEREALEAEVERLWEAVAGAIYLLDPEPEDILRGAGIYRIVLAYHLSGGVLSDDLMTLLEEMKEKSDGHKPDGKTYGDQPLADRSAPARGLVRWR
jgi:hypothetical protein